MKINNQSGLTLVEIVVGLALLSLAVMSATLSYISITRLQQKSISIQKVQQNARFVLEAISRDARNASAVLVSNGGATIELTNGFELEGQIVSYEFDSTINKVFRCTYPIGETCLTAGARADVSTDEVRVINLAFTVASPPNAPNYITVNMTFEQATAGITPQNPEFQRFDLSTIVSTRTNTAVGGP